MFSRSAHLYDAVYAFKDYAAEVERLRQVIDARVPSARTLLDVACGTGMHLAELRRWYEVEGLDLDPQLLAFARERLPDVPLHEGDMTAFDLGREFDVVTCLFSSIAYVRTARRTSCGHGRAGAAPRAWRVCSRSSHGSSPSSGSRTSSAPSSSTSRSSRSRG